MLELLWKILQAVEGEVRNAKSCGYVIPSNSREVNNNYDVEDHSAGDAGVQISGEKVRYTGMETCVFFFLRTRRLI